MNTIETISAIATPFGRGGIGVIRVSGPLTSVIAYELLGKLPIPRRADYLPFFGNNRTVLDQGIAIFFAKPKSFTGEDLLELQGHGGPVILNLLLQRILEFPGVRIANPGEFSERAFLNGKIDLIQAEAISDLIDASSAQAAIAAVDSLKGVFSKHIYELLEIIIN